MKRALLAAGILIAATTSAHAFCGFYVSGGDQQMFNDATQVVLMRKGTRTVLSMQNNYKGPPAAFAMVIPVPVVLKETDVKTLPKAVFESVERMGAPRLVEYWEQDPCQPVYEVETKQASSAPVTGGTRSAPSRKADLGVTIEAEFTVGEYQIQILSAKDSTGLDTWLRQEKYNIPAGAEPLLRPYVESGMKFFVAKVDPTKVTFNDGRAELSPLRFHYDTDQFNLPIRLGLANSSGTQDLIVNILAPNQRYDVANYKNVTIPTNIDVKPSVKDKFGAFYTALFDATVEKNPGAVVTEYAWQATTCDPCPGPQLGYHELMTLGLDVVDAGAGGTGPINQPSGSGPPASSGRVAPPMRRRIPSSDMVLTRLHARYGKDITNDLVFMAAPPIVGGREFVVDPQTHKLEEGAKPSSTNNFQGRYAIRHAWEGEIKCEKPVRNRWGGPPGGGQPSTKPALDLAFAPRDTVKVANEVKQDVPELGILLAHAGTMTPDPSKPPSSEPIAGTTKKKTGCGCGTSGDTGSLLVLAGVVLMLRRRKQAA